MKHHRILIPTALATTLLLAACAPGTKFGKNPDLGSRAYAVQQFTLAVKDAVVTPLESSYKVEAEDFTLAVTMRDTGFAIILSNKTDSNLTVNYDRSAASVRGLSSRIIPGNASWMTRNSSQPPSIALPNATVFESLSLVEYMYFSSGIKFLPMFYEDHSQTGDIVLSPALEVNESPRTLTLTFSPKG